MTSAVLDDANHNELKAGAKGCSTLLPKIKARRSLDEFNQFISFILAYEAGKEDDAVAVKPETRSPHSPSGSSTSSMTDSLSDDHRRHSLKRPRGGGQQQRKKTNDADEEYDSDDESWGEVTCYCRKPFAGRSMIECSHCLTWVHLSCAKIRKSKIPKKFTCQRCRDTHPHSAIFFNNAVVAQKGNSKTRKKVSP